MKPNYERTFGYIWSNKPQLKKLLENANYYTFSEMDPKQRSGILIMSRTIYGYPIDISDSSYDKNLFNPLEVNKIPNKQLYHTLLYNRTRILIIN